MQNTLYILQGNNYTKKFAMRKLKVSLNEHFGRIDSVPVFPVINEGDSLRNFFPQVQQSTAGRHDLCNNFTCLIKV